MYVSCGMSLTCALQSLSILLVIRISAIEVHTRAYTTCICICMIKRLPQHLKLILPLLILFVTYLLPLISNISTSIVCRCVCECECVCPRVRWCSCVCFRFMQRYRKHLSVAVSHLCVSSRCCRHLLHFPHLLY